MRAARLVVAFAGFILIGISAGVSGVLLPSQMSDYHIDKVVVGLQFFTFSSGYLLSGIANGTLIRRLGERRQLSLGATVFVGTAIGIGLRPGFGIFLAATVLLGFGTGILDAGLNAYVSNLPGHTALLNYLHAFFGVGALIGPQVGTLLLHAGRPWPDAYLLVGVLAVPILIGLATLYPSRLPPPPDAHAAPLPAALRRRSVWLSGGFLCLYVGIEVTVGDWGFSLLTQQRHAGELLAGLVVSGYWLGLTLGRFVINAATSRAGLGVVAMMFCCLGGLVAATTLTWWVPDAVVGAIGFGLIGFFLGPVYPTTVAVQPRLMPSQLVPTAVGLLIGASVVGGAGLPWVAGALAQGLGLGSLLPYTLVMSVVLLGGWWAIARRMAGPPRPRTQPVPGAPVDLASVSGPALGEAGDGRGGG
jgi:fucose permease